MEEFDCITQEERAGECRIRDVFAARLAEFRPDERVIKTEYRFGGARARADLRTVDRQDLLRVWEFKVHCDYDGLGQALSYLALARREVDFERPVKGVLAAFEFREEVVLANEVLNLGLEFVILPPKLWLAGRLPSGPQFTTSAPDIPLPTVQAPGTDKRT